MQDKQDQDVIEKMKGSVEKDLEEAKVKVESHKLKKVQTLKGEVDRIIRF